MPFIIWSDRLDLGIEEIDSDHRKMAGLINDLYDAIAAKVGREVIEGIIAQVISYTSIHFACEDRIRAVTSYAEAETHKTVHDAMRVWAKGVPDEHQSSSLTARSLELMVCLKDWLFEHILGGDRYAPFLTNSAFDKAAYIPVAQSRYTAVAMIG
jgi:hemerythrin-like metal-binding protein